MHCLHVLRDGPIRGEPTQASLPCMEVSVDEPRQNDHLRSIENVCAFYFYIFGDCCNSIAFNEDICASEIADGGIHRHNIPALN